MNAPTYLIAKYAPDVTRMEPRNIGVILWASSGVAYRFLPTDEAQFVQDLDMYARWTKSWAEACDQPTLQTKRGAIVKRRSVDFLKALIDTQAGNYFLYEGGFIADHVPANDRSNAVDFLYRRLVAEDSEVTTDTDAVPATLAAKCTEVLDTTGLSEREDFQPEYSLDLEADGVTLPYKFDYALAGEFPSALLLRVDAKQQKSTTSAAFLFEHVKDNPRAKLAKRLAFVDSTFTNDTSASRTALLRKVCDGVIDLADLDRAAKELQQLRL
jgi:hypothetical protein